jgi:hypothetical protein
MLMKLTPDEKKTMKKIRFFENVDKCRLDKVSENQKSKLFRSKLTLLLLLVSTLASPITAFEMAVQSVHPLRQHLQQRSIIASLIVTGIYSEMMNYLNLIQGWAIFLVRGRFKSFKLYKNQTLH